ncbi:ribonuclease kappa-B [Onthophagus taurus]|uniref:ribonuclease kappa-B n=1 Tax=Onthophagus taurus TaxID=166361 RepID=UPI000C2023D6|nr:ribonuclease kappa-B [Onthophagus taurus]
MPVCGPKLSLCGLILSVWGIVQLTLMGIFYYTHSVALAEDLPLGHDFETADDFYTAANTAYAQNAYNCWIAACIYLITLAVAGHQFWMNSRSSLSV